SPLSLPFPRTSRVREDGLLAPTLLHRRRGRCTPAVRVLQRGPLLTEFPFAAVPGFEAHIKHRFVKLAAIPLDRARRLSDMPEPSLVMACPTPRGGPVRCLGPILRGTAPIRPSLAPRPVLS